MEDLVIIGTGGFAKEVLWLIEEINMQQGQWNILGFIDEYSTKIVHGYNVIGDDQWLLNYKDKINVVCAVGSPKIKKKIIEKLKNKSNIVFPNIIAYDIICDYKNVDIGVGCIISFNNVITTDIKIGNFVTINLSCTIGHDTVIEDYVTINPGSNISGSVYLGECANIGTGTKVIQGVSVGENTILGAGTVVIHNIPDNCTAVGVPERITKGLN